MNAEHGEENVQVNANTYVHRWVDRIKVKEFGVVRVFLAIQRNYKIVKKKRKKLQKLIIEVQKKTKQNRKNQNV